MPELQPDEYRCAMCNNVYKLIRDEDWNQEKADEEYKRLFPGESMQNRDIICDDCFQLVRPDRRRSRA